MTKVAVVTANSPLIPVEVAVAAVAPENVGRTDASIRSPTVPTSITCIMAVNEFRTLFVPVRDSAATSLGHCVRGCRKNQQQTQYQDSKNVC